MRPLERVGGFLLFGDLSTGVYHCSCISTGFAVNFGLSVNFRAKLYYSEK
jgi:hypothetical protein